LGCGAECREPDYGMERTFLGWRNLRRRNFMLAAFIWGRRVGRPDLFSCSFPCKLNFLVLASQASQPTTLSFAGGAAPYYTVYTTYYRAHTHRIRNCQPANQPAADSPRRTYFFEHPLLRSGRLSNFLSTRQHSRSRPFRHTHTSFFSAAVLCPPTFACTDISHGCLFSRRSLIDCGTFDCGSASPYFLPPNFLHATKSLARSPQPPQLLPRRPSDCLAAFSARIQCSSRQLSSAFWLRAALCKV